MKNQNEKKADFKSYDRLKSFRTTVSKEDLFQQWDPIKIKLEEQKRVTELDVLEKRRQELENLKEFLHIERENVTEKGREIAQVFGTVQSLLKNFEQLKKQNWAENAGEIVDFAIALAEKIVQQRIQEDPTILINQVKSIVSQIDKKTNFEVRMNPDDLLALQKSELEEVRSFFSANPLNWIADVNLARGEIYIDTSMYRLDASIMTAFKNLKEDLKRVRATEEFLDPEMAQESAESGIGLGRDDDSVDASENVVGPKEGT